MASGYFLGLDSGGTKTDVALLAPDGSFVAGIMGGGVRLNTRHVPPSAAMVLRELIDHVLRQAKIGWDEVAHFGMGVCGVDFDDEIPAQKRQLVRMLGIDPAKTSLVNDGVVALWGGSAKANAVILQLGSAFTAAYRHGFGTETPFDHLNAGVIVDIRRQILATCSRSWDGRLPKSILPDLILAHLEIDNPIEAVKRFVRGKIELWKLMMVIDPWRVAVEKGDRVACNVARDLAKVYAADVVHLIGLAGGKADVVLGGGVLRYGPAYFRDQIAAGVRRAYPAAKIHLPELSPAIGGAVMAAHDAGAPHRDIFKRARQTAGLK